MKTPAIIVAFTIVGSLAFAAGQARVMPPQAPDHPSLPPMDDGKHGGSGGEGGVAMQAGQGDDCVTIGSPLNVFTNIHPFPSCVAQSWGDAGIIARGRTLIDLDSDGDEDKVVVKYQFHCPLNEPPWYQCCTSYLDSNVSLGGCVVDGEYQGTPTILWLQTMTWTGTSVAVVQQPLLTMDHLYQCLYRLNSWNPGYNYWAILRWSLIDFVDVDGDRDLDLVVRLTGYRDPIGSNFSEDYDVHLWLENTGSFNNTVGADVNRDGVVNGQDLAYVLAAWTP